MTVLYVKNDIYTVQGMNWKLSAETRCSYFPVRSNAASMQHTVSVSSFQSALINNVTAAK